MKKLISILILTLTVINANAQSASTYMADAKSGNAEAQYQLGHCYEKGNGVKQDLAEAAIWYRKAAKQGNPARHK
jgi:TPR repeat protein